jgi:hypothetical protein
MSMSLKKHAYDSVSVKKTSIFLDNNNKKNLLF